MKHETIMNRHNLKSALQVCNLKEMYKGEPRNKKREVYKEVDEIYKGIHESYMGIHGISIKSMKGIYKGIHQFCGDPCNL